MPRRKGGLFLPLDVGFPDDDRIVDVGEKAAWLYLMMSLAAKRLNTDGVLTERQIDRLHVTAWKPRLAELLRVELVVPYSDGEYLVAGWHKHNDPSALVAERRRKDAERKRSGVGSDSDRSRDVEKNREEKRTSARTELRSLPPVGKCDLHLLPLPCCGCAADAKAASA